MMNGKIAACGADQVDWRRRRLFFDSRMITIACFLDERLIY